jgi:hypothetical protein
MASKHYWDYHSKELRDATQELCPNKRYIDVTEKEERAIKRLASKFIKAKKEKYYLKC